MTYRCLGNNQYEITLVVYRDCFFGDPLAYFDDTAYVGVFDGFNQLVETRLVPFMMVDDTLSGQSFNPCLQIPDVYCVHSTMYRDTVFLDPALANGGYTLAYQRCCRNQTIVNIFDPVETGTTFSTFISEASMGVCNNSAVFPEWPPIAICVNEPLVYSHAATDADGDSLVYRLCTPFAGGTINDGQPAAPSHPPFDTVVWVTPPFSVDNMLGGVPLAIDSQTGLMTATPSIIGQFVVGVCVEEYRDGQLLSVTKRDFQYNVTVCEEISSGIADPQPECGQLEITFENESSGAEAYEWTFFSDTTVLGVSTDTHASFTFPDTGLYTVQLVASTQNGCKDTASIEVFLFDDDITPDFDLLVLDCEETVLVDIINLTVDPGNKLVSSVWELRTDFNVVVASGYEPQFIVQPFDIPYELTLTVTSQNGCVDQISKELFLKPIGPPDQLHDTLTICKGDTVDLFPIYVPGYVYEWSPATGLSDASIPNPKGFPSSTTVYSLQIADSSGQCHIERTVTVIVVEPLLEVEPQYSCDGFEVIFNNPSPVSDSYFWDFGVPNQTTDTSTAFSPTFLYPDSGTFIFTLVRTSAPSCGVADTLTATVQPGIPDLKAGFSASIDECQTDSVQVDFEDLSVSVRDSLTSWQWVIGADTFFGEKPPPVQVVQNTELVVSLTVETEEGCKDSITDVFDIQVATTGGLEDTVFICAGDSVGLFPGANPDLVYSWFPETGLSDPFAANPLASPDSQTTYVVQVEVLGPDTCIFSFEVTVVPIELPALGVIPDTIICEDEATLAIEIDQGSIVIWTDLDGDTIGIGPELTVKPNGSEQYSIKAVNSFGCESFGSVHVEGRMVNQILHPSDTFLCPGDEVVISIENLNVNDSISWLWTPDSLIVGSAEGSFVVVSSSETGNYELIVTGSNLYGCTASDTARLAVAPGTEGIAIAGSQGCDGYGVQFSAQGPAGFSYTWFFGDGSGAASGENPFYLYADTGTYTVMVIIGEGGACPDTLSLDISVLGTSSEFENQFPADTVTCADSILLTVSSSGLESIVWLDEFLQPVGTMPGITLQVTDTSTYYLERTDVLGCTRITDTIRVIPDGFEIELMPDQTICLGETAIFPLLGQPADLEYSADGSGVDIDIQADSLLVISPAQTGIFSVVVSAENASGCLAVDTTLITVLDTARLDGSITLAQCSDSTVIFQSNHPLAAHIRWHFGDPSDPDAFGTGSQATHDYPGEGLYQAFAVIDSVVACTDTLYFEVPLVAEAGFQFEVDWSFSSCDSPVVIRLIDLSSHNPDSITYQQWVFGGGDTIQEPVAEVSPDSIGLVYFELQIITEGGCSASFSDTLVVPQVELLLPDSLQICPGQSVALNPSGNPSYQYIWMPSGSLSDSLEANPVAMPEFSTLYTVEITVPLSGDTCTFQEQVFVEVAPVLEYESTGDAVFCEDQELTLFVTPFEPVSQILWATDPEFSDTLGSADTIEVETGRPGFYYFELTDTFGCKYYDTIEVSSFAPDVNITLPTSICKGDTVILETFNVFGSDTLSYFWEPADQILSGWGGPFVVVAPDETTNFVVEYINQFGCVGSDTVTVNVAATDSIIVTANPDTIALGGSSQLDVTELPGFSYIWEPDDGTLNNPEIRVPTASPDETTTYLVEATTPDGCTVQSSVTVFVIQRSCIEPYIFVPQAFTPNGDGENDELFVYGNPIEELELVIYNRWGEKVFETRDKDQGWDGSFKNEVQPPDVYAYYLKVLCINGEEFVKKGNITLLR